MRCPNCETENPDNAKFCKTCGINLQETNTFVENEEVNTYTPTVENNANYQQNNTTTSTNTQNKGDSDWWICCICLVGIFIVFAIFGH